LSGRSFDRIPYTVEVQFRTRSSFLIAYSVNLSRGGMFVETDQPASVGTELNLRFQIHDAGVYQIVGRVTWIRQTLDPESGQPPGMGIEFDEVDGTLGEVIDSLVSQFSGLNIALLIESARDRNSLSRAIKSIVASANVLDTTHADLSALAADDLDLVVFDADAAAAAGPRLLAGARNRERPVPLIALAATPAGQTLARAVGAEEQLDNPPHASDLQEALLRALGRPMKIV
jgi:type IV pilus assembly protein PilZ